MKWNFSMSNPGLYSSIYERIRDYAEIVDDVIVHLKENRTAVNFPSRQRLIDLLHELVEDQPDDLTTRLLALMLGGRNPNRRAAWTKTSNTLLQNSTEESLIVELEAFAQLLERCQADAIAKMRGCTR
jgi:hypothetical protein